MKTIVQEPQSSIDARRVLSLAEWQSMTSVSGKDFRVDFLSALL